MRNCIETLQKSEGFERTLLALNTVKEKSEMEYVYMVYFPNPDDPQQMAYVLNAYTEKEDRKNRKRYILSATLVVKGTLTR